MKSTTKRKVDGTPSDGADAITRYGQGQAAEPAALCAALRREIDATLPKATAKIWHGSPVWFIGGNPVVGYSVTSKQSVNLLFWNGQSFGDPALRAVGKFRAAQILFTDASQIDAKALRRWLNRARTDVWDYRAYFLSQKALQKKANP